MQIKSNFFCKCIPNWICQVGQSFSNYIPNWHQRTQRFYWNKHAWGQRGGHHCNKNRKQWYIDVPISIFNHKVGKPKSRPYKIILTSISIPPFFLSFSSVCIRHPTHPSHEYFPFNFLDMDKKVLILTQSLMPN